MSFIWLERLPDKSVEGHVKEKNLEIKVQLPVVLGRGAVLKCPEKKVSRSHATLDWDDEGVLVTSTHLNPTFLIIDGVERTLKEGESAVLKAGDQFGLLCEKFWFKLHFEEPSERNKKPVNGSDNIDDSARKIKESTKLNKLESSCTITSSELSAPNKDICTPPHLETKSEEKENKKQIASTLVCNTNDSEVPIKIEGAECLTKVPPQTLAAATVPNANGAAEDQEKSPPSNPSSCVEKLVSDEDLKEEILISRKRELPKWMSESDDATSSKNNQTKTGNAQKQGNKTKNKPHGSEKKVGKAPKTNKPSQKGLEYESDEEVSDKPTRITKKKASKVNESPKTANKKQKDKQYHTISLDCDDVDVDVEDTNKSSRHHHVSDSDGDELDNTTVKQTPKKLSPVLSNEQGVVAKVDPKSPLSSKKRSKEADSNEEEENEPRTKKFRPSCQYGGQCYRRNPDHKKDFSHPGDSDYRDPVEENDSDDDRPECEHGIDCYRKNPQHKKDFKHTRVPQPQRQAKRKAKLKKKKNEDDEYESDDDDYEDSFIDDGSSDEYVPSESD